MFGPSSLKWIDKKDPVFYNVVNSLFKEYFPCEIICNISKYRQKSRIVKRIRNPAKPLDVPDNKEIAYHYLRIGDILMDDSGIRNGQIYIIMENSDQRSTHISKLVAISIGSVHFKIDVSISSFFLDPLYFFQHLYRHTSGIIKMQFNTHSDLHMTYGFPDNYTKWEWHGPYIERDILYTRVIQAMTHDSQIIHCR